jgi:hypothetical protein
MDANPALVEVGRLLHDLEFEAVGWRRTALQASRGG